MRALAFHSKSPLPLPEQKIRPIDIGKHQTIAFTLMELLVTVAVIAILAALLIGAIHNAKQAGYATVCRNNLKQWSIAMAMFVQDTDSYPTFEDAPRQPYSCWDRLVPYTAAVAIRWVDFPGVARQRVGIHICPSYLSEIDNSTQFRWIGSYGYNSAGLDKGYPYQHFGYGLAGKVDLKPEIRFIPTREDELTAPSDMIMLADSNLIVNPFSDRVFPRFRTDKQLCSLYYEGWAALGLVPLGTNAIMDMPVRYVVTKIRNRHKGRWNVAFCDSHIQSLSLNEMFDLRYDATASRWAKDHLPHRELLPNPVR